MSTWRHFDVNSNIFALLPNIAAVIATVIQLRIKLGNEQTFHSRFAYKQVRRKFIRQRRMTFHMTIYGTSPTSPIWKIKHDFFDNTTTSITLTAQILVLRPRRQLGYLNSNLMLRWDGHLPPWLKLVAFVANQIIKATCIVFPPHNLFYFWRFPGKCKALILDLH